MINWNATIFDNATDEQKMDGLRLWRNQELAATDWTQLPDAQVDKAAWADYRQQLRDLPEQNDNPTKIAFPVRPS